MAISPTLFDDGPYILVLTLTPDSRGFLNVHCEARDLWTELPTRVTGRLCLTLDHLLAEVSAQAAQCHYRAQSREEGSGAAT